MPECMAAGSFARRLESVVKKMARNTLGPIIAMAALVFWGDAQTATVSDFIRSQAVVQGRAFSEATRAMPADLYEFRPDTDQMTFGELVLHVADGNYLFCSHIGNAAEPAVSVLSATAPKEGLIKRLQESFDFCTRALSTLDDVGMSEMLDIGVTKTPRSMAILTLSGSWNTHISMARDYLSRNGKTLP